MQSTNQPQPVVEQLTIWTLLDRVSADPLDTNIIDLSKGDARNDLLLALP